MGNIENEEQTSTSPNRRLWSIFVEWFLNHTDIRQAKDHYRDFWFIWEILILFAIGTFLFSSELNWQNCQIIFVAIVSCTIWSPLRAICGQTKTGRILRWAIFIIIILGAFWCISLSSSYWTYNKWWCRIMLIGLAVLIILRPMNAVYGLMGTSGSIRIFFFNFVIISLIFSFIYYFGFFKDAGISYDINQPHINYRMFEDPSKTSHVTTSIKREAINLELQLDSISFRETVIHETTDTLHYQNINFIQVWRSTILTTLIQEPAELLSIASIFNEAAESSDTELDKEKSEMFEWIIIFHIIISWIFFGVFISLLYNKFRYES